MIPKTTSISCAQIPAGQAACNLSGSPPKRAVRKDMGPLPAQNLANDKLLVSTYVYVYVCVYNIYIYTVYVYIYIYIVNISLFYGWLNYPFKVSADRIWSTRIADITPKKRGFNQELRACKGTIESATDFDPRNRSKLGTLKRNEG